MSYIKQKVKELDARVKCLDPRLFAEQDPEWVLSERIRIGRESMGVVNILQCGLVPFVSADRISMELNAADMWKSRIMQEFRKHSQKKSDLIS